MQGPIPPAPPFPPLMYPVDQYVPQPHHCYHQIEKDRIRLVNQRLLVDLNKAHMRIQDLRQQLLTEQLSSGQNRRKPRHRGAQKRKHEEVIEAKANVPLVIYIPLTDEEKEQKLTNIFGSLFKISDIIALASHPNKKCLEQNEKFGRLVRICKPLADMDALVGLDDIKSKTFDIIAHYILNKTPQPADLMHMVISGPPGVGKTEVGKLIGKIILGLGVLKSDKFVCARRSELIGEYLGQTAPKTQQVINSAIGGVLFIDEAYSLGHSDKRDSFSKECIDCLNQNLTDKKGQFLCIIAGYEKELETCFFAVNKGLQRRFPVQLNISGYSAEELYKIFVGKVEKDNWTVAPSAGLSLFQQKHKQFKYFAGDAETLFHQAKFVAAGRYLRNSAFSEAHSLSVADIEEAYKQEIGKREDDTNVLLHMFT